MARKPGRQPVFPEVGVTGLKQYSGMVNEEFVPQLRGQRGMRILREMRDNSAAVGACLGAIEMLIRQVTWYVKPPVQGVSTSPNVTVVADEQDKFRTNFFNESMHDMSFTWTDTLTDFLSMLWAGWSYNELVYKRRMGDTNDPKGRSKYNDGLISWRKMPGRAQDTLYKWDIDEEGGIQAMLQQAPPDYKLRTIPIEKALLFRPRVEKNNPEGRSILRSGYFSWYHAKEIMRIEAVAIERDLNGFPVVRVPGAMLAAGASDEQKKAVADYTEMGKNIRNDEQMCAIIPSDRDETGQAYLYDIQLLATSGRRQHDTSAVITRYERAIVASMLYDLLMMGQPNTIQYKGKGMAPMFAISLAGWCDSITETLNAHAVPRNCRLNGWPTSSCPRFEHGDVAAPDLSALGDYISKVWGPGATFLSDPTLHAHLMRVADLPVTDGTPTPEVRGSDSPDSPPGPDDEGDDDGDEVDE